MLKYVEAKVTFAEVPDEITLCINISHCQIKCEGCHSKYLWNDIGKLLTTRRLKSLIDKNIGISCICFMGDGGNPSEITRLCRFVKDEYNNIKTACYLGEDVLPEEIELPYLDYFKIGHFNGVPLNKEGTNQRMYSIVYTSLGLNLVDITSKFWKHETEN